MYSDYPLHSKIRIGATLSGKDVRAPDEAPHPFASSPRQPRFNYLNDWPM